MINPAYQDDQVTVHLGDCLDVLATLPDGSVDAVVTDPPAGIAFMGREWDRDKGGRDEWVAWLASVLREAFRVAKPGAHAFVWALPRTSGWTHRALEDAGWEVRDCVTHLFGSGFPKSLDVSKAIDKAAGAERGKASRGPTACPDFPDECNGHPTANGSLGGGVMRHALPTTPATDAAREWQGWGTALKPSSEHWWLARKPFVGTVAANVTVYGAGALNIDATRVPFASTADERESKDKNRHADFGTEAGGNNVYGDYSMVERANYTASGRWPANVVLDDTQAAALDASTVERGHDDQGGPSRFFPTFRYEAKAPTVERPNVDGIAHATVKPLDLMRWLVRLVTPRGGLVLDPFAGSGTTGEACVVEGFKCILIEREPTYLPLIVARLSKPIQVGLTFDEETA